MSIQAITEAGPPRSEEARLLRATLVTMRRRGPRTAGRLQAMLEVGRGRRFDVFVRPESEHPRGLLGTVARDLDAAVIPGVAAPGPTRIGTGRGTSSDVYLDLARFPRSPRGPFPPDEVLFHELVHALANMYGLRDTTPAPRPRLASPQFHYDEMSEFVAITFTNMYRSEARSPALRWDHDPSCHRERLERPVGPHDPVDARTAEETRLLTRLAMTWAGRDGGFMSFMAGLPLELNPFRTYLQMPASHVPRPGRPFPGSGPCL